MKQSVHTSSKRSAYTSSKQSNAPRRENKRLVIGLFVASIGMFGFGFALVPLYDVLCDVLGINGKTSAQAQQYQPQTVSDRVVTVEFISLVPKTMAWEFEPQVKQMQVRVGELIRTAYTANNTSNQRIVGQAIPSVSPGIGAAYFQKTECFCFNQQILEAHSDAELPLIFFIDHKLPEHITTITLSYTLFDITDRQAAAIPASRSLSL